MDEFSFHTLEQRPGQSFVVEIVGLGVGDYHSAVPILDCLLAQSQGTAGFVGLERLLSSGDTKHGGGRHWFLSTVSQSDLAHLGLFVAADFRNAIHGTHHVTAFHTHV